MKILLLHLPVLVMAGWLVAKLLVGWSLQLCALGIISLVVALAFYVPTLLRFYGRHRF